ncbi:MAG TPA: c-type cytochrome [Syntrophorhabdaceae bacterium]|jgi:mono/diheme cytochrome c family protein
MRRRESILSLKAACLLVALLTLGSCDYGRMRDQDSVRTYERKIPAMDARTMPRGDSFFVLSRSDPKELKSPLTPSPEAVERGRVTYAYFCAQCHGPKLDGRGTVGQSFTPLPTDLSSKEIDSRGDGELYARIRLGFRRHPALFSTVPAEDAWAVVIYIRSLHKGGS